MHPSREHPSRSLVTLAAAAMLCGAPTGTHAGRPLPEPLERSIQERLDPHNFGLSHRWRAPVRILNRSDERIRSIAVFRLAQVAAQSARVVRTVPPVPKPGFRVRAPVVREAVEVARADHSGSTVPGFRRSNLDLRDRDPAQRASLLQPYAGSWMGDAGAMPIQEPINPPMQPQVIPPPVPAAPAPTPTPEPEIPTIPATTDMPKPELFPSGDSPTSIFPMPWETSTGHRLEPSAVPRATVEPEPEEPPPLPNELPLRPVTSQWDLAELEGPLFGTEQIAEFTQEVNTQGAWSVRPRFSTTALYDGNVFLSEDGQDSDFIITATPGIMARVGNEQTPFYLTADYALGAVFFTNNSDENSINHNGKLQLDWRGARTSVGLRLGAEHDSGTSIDATDRVQRTTFGGGLQTHFAYSEKFSADLNADYRRSYYEDLIGSYDYGVQTYVNYHITPKVTLGLGGGFTGSEVETGRSQQSQNVSFRATWVATGKLTMEGTLGVGFYQFSDDEPDAIAPIASLRATYVATQKLTFSGNVGVGVSRFASDGNSLSPTFDLDATWAIWDGTVLTFNAHSRVFNSVVYSDQNYTSTGCVAGVRQNLGIRFVAFATLGYENLEYTSAGDDVDADRQDDYFFARFGLQWHAFSRCDFGIFYEFSQNSSQGEEARDFRRDRAGIQMSVVF